MFLERFPRGLILTGPTGSGKSALAVELAVRLGAEIVSMDSMALYRRMDIGTAKPNAEERRRVPHHLLDVLEPWESASVAWWLARATACYDEVAGRGKRVLFVGGTALYLKALLYGLFEGPPADAALRRRLTAEAEFTRVTSASFSSPRRTRKRRLLRPRRRSSVQSLPPARSAPGHRAADRFRR